MSKLPSGTVTFLFTDIEGSTKLWEKLGQIQMTRMTFVCKKACPYKVP